jgi:chitinase
MQATMTFRREADWNTGFVGYVTLNANAPITGWTLSFTGEFNIDNIWGATIVDREGDRYLVRSADWTAAVAPGTSVTFGFTATTSVVGAAPSAFRLGGPEVLSLDPSEPPVPPTLSIAAAEALESAGHLVFRVSLDRASASAVSFAYATQAGTARPSSDYVGATGTVTIAAGQTSAEVRIALRDDTSFERTETMSVQLSSLVGATGGILTATGTILDNDGPRISVADATIIEGQSGVAQMNFTISLSEASFRSVVVRYATADGSASAGSDYVARSGSVTFAAGETVKTVSIGINGDTLREGDETFSLLLSNPTRAVIADGIAIGTIRNDDAGGVQVRIADAIAVTEGDPGGQAMVGVLSTRGSQIIDETGAPVRLAAVNWFGMETARKAPDGLHARNWKDMMDQMLEAGFNAIRLPFSAEAILESGQPTSINGALNPDLVGLNSLQILDKIVDYAGTIGLRIILDHHRSFAGDGPNGNGLWYDGRFTEARWVEMWTSLAQRYAGDPTVVGADLSNEPFGAVWNAWASAAERAGNAILSVNPDWLIIVEGVAVHDGVYGWWGGNLMGAKARPVTLSVSDKLVYSPHDYPETIYPQPWLNASNYPDNLPAVFDRFWGHLYHEGIAPILLGEFGSRLDRPRDVAWLQEIIGTLQGDRDGDGDIDTPGAGMSFAWWSWNPNSGDTGGIMADDWRTLLTHKLDALEPLLSDPVVAPAVASFEVTLDAAATSAVTMGWRTRAGTAGDADFVSATGVLSFAPGETRKTITVLLRPDELAESQEEFTVELFDLVGGTLADGTASARIIDDDWAL